MVFITVDMAGWPYPSQDLVWRHNSHVLSQDISLDGITTYSVGIYGSGVLHKRPHQPTTGAYVLYIPDPIK